MHRHGLPFGVAIAAASALLFAALPVAARPAAAPTGKASADCPSDMALVGSTCVDKYEASLVEVREGRREVPYSPYESPAGHAVRAVSRRGVVPQAHISMVEAQKACRASGKRLCHAKEWKAACRGPENTRYPYGKQRVENACVDTNRTSPVMKLHNGEHTSRTLNDPALNQQDDTLEATGEAAACTNGYGVHDMVGNVHEWTDDKSFRGGYYLDTKINGEGCEYRTTAHSAIYYDYSTGFRCCADEGAAPGEDLASHASEPTPSSHADGGVNSAAKATAEAAHNVPASPWQHDLAEAMARGNLVVPRRARGEKA